MIVRERIDRARRAALRPVVRRLRSPFPDGIPAPVVLHCTHHKAGWSWFRNILEAVAERYGLRYRNLLTEPGEGAEIAIGLGGVVDVDTFGDVVGSHMIRDPRDVVVSGYHYHLWTTEAWALEPSPEHGGLSYQEHLRSVDTEEGMNAEIRHALPVIEQMVRWDYDDPRFLELRYEDAIDEPVSTYEAAFRHYGFAPDEAAACVALADRFSFHRVTGRRIGEEREGSHLRSGRPGQWRDVFTPANAALFKELTGDALVALGYESDMGW